MADFDNPRTQNITIALVSLLCLLLMGTCVAGAVCLTGAFCESKECEP